MNLQDRLERPDTAAARAALATLRAWAAQASPDELARLDPAIARLSPGQPLANSPALARSYDADFRPDAAYKAAMPDLQNGPASLIVGAKTRIAHVGISNFRLPIRYRLKAGGARELNALLSTLTVRAHSADHAGEIPLITFP